MIYNDKKIAIKEVEASYIIRKNSFDTFIKIVSVDDQRIIFTFCDKNFDPRKLELNKTIDLKNLVYWDVTLVTKETYYLFDLTKDEINLTRLEDNKFNLKVHIENPDMIYSPLGENATFKNLIIDKDFSFVYED